MFNCHYIAIICLIFFYAVKITCFNGPFTLVSVWWYLHVGKKSGKNLSESRKCEIWSWSSQFSHVISIGLTGEWNPWGESCIGHCGSEIFLFFCESPLIHAHALDTRKWWWKNMPNEIWIKIYIEILCKRFMADWYVAEHWQVLIESGIVVINLGTGW